MISCFAIRQCIDMSTIDLTDLTDLTEIILVIRIVRKSSFKTTINSIKKILKSHLLFIEKIDRRSY